MTILASMRSTNLLGIVKTPYIPYDIITLNQVSGTITVAGNGTTCISAFKTSGSNVWDSQMNSATAYNAPCTMEFTKLAASTDNGLSYTMIGWNADPTTDANYTSIDHASYPFVTSSYQVYNNGTVQNPGGVWDPNKRFYITYGTDGFIRHWNGSTQLYSANYGTGKTVYLDSSFYSVDSTYGGVINLRITKLTWNGNAYV